MANFVFLILTFFALQAVQCFIAHRCLRGDLNVVLQLGAVIGVAIACAAIWYVLAVKLGWSLPIGRRGLSTAPPKEDAGVVFAMGLIWYAIAVTGRFNRRR